MQTGGGNRSAAILGAFVLVAAAIVALVFLLGPGRIRAGRRDGTTGSPPTAAEPTPTLSEAVGSQASSDPGRTADASTASTAAASISTGVLRLEFVSTLDGGPVADLPFLVYRERGGLKDLARGRSDAQGRAEVRDLDENVILVVTPRRPPFASKVDACWLGRGETKELVVGLDGGARVVGRVVDDAQQPVDGAEVLVAADYATESTSDPIDREHPAAVTGPDGKFAVDQMASRPRGVWIVDGRARPEHWDAAEMFVRKECAVARKLPDVKPGTIFDLGDVMIERCAILGGTVLDSDNRPVPGALVSWRQEREYARMFGSTWAGGDPLGFGFPPGREGFRLRPGEAMTDSIGAFEIRANLENRRLLVWSPSGQLQSFGAPKIPPSERVDGIVLKLDAISVLEIEFLDRSGARITGPGPTAREKGLRIWGPAQTWLFPSAAVVRIRIADGKREEVKAPAEPDGLFRFELKTPPSRVQAIALSLAGYETVEDDLAGRLQPVTRLTYVLRETPALRLRLEDKSTDSSRAASGDQTSKLSLQICLASPEQRKNMTADGCCGLGAWVVFDRTNGPRDFVLPAIAPRPYWVYLRGAETGSAPESFGPFEAGDTVHEIEADLGRILLVPEKAEVPPEPIEPGTKIEFAYVTARAVDARTDAAIPKFMISGRRWRDGKEIDSFTFVPAEEDGAVGSKRIHPGVWDFTLTANGYRKAAIPDVHLVEDQRKDLGTIALEPAPVFRVRLLEEGGSPVPRQSWIRAMDADHPGRQWAPMTITDAEGRAAVYEEVPERVLLETIEPYDDETGEGGGAQRTLVDRWTPGVEKEIRLAAWQRVEVRIGGAALDPPGAFLHVLACPAPGEPNALCDHNGPIGPKHHSLSEGREVEASPTRRTFRFSMAAGRYQVYGRDLLHEVPAQEIEVRDSPDMQVFELTSR